MSPAQESREQKSAQKQTNTPPERARLGERQKASQAPTSPEMRKKSPAGSGGARASPRFAAKGNRTAEGEHHPPTSQAIEILANVSDFLGGLARAAQKQLSRPVWHSFGYQVALLLCACGVAMVAWTVASYVDQEGTNKNCHSTLRFHSCCANHSAGNVEQS